MQSTVVAPDRLRKTCTSAAAPQVPRVQTPIRIVPLVCMGKLGKSLGIRKRGVKARGSNKKKMLTIVG